MEKLITLIRLLIMNTKRVLSYNVGVGEDIGIHQTTACKVIWQVCNRIVDKSIEWIRFPSTAEELRNAQLAWNRKNKIPNAIGAIDCTHAQIMRPHHHPDEFITEREQHPSIYKLHAMLVI